MTATLHLPRLRQLRRWPTPGARFTLALALALFAVVFALRINDPNVGDAEGALFIVPICLLALRFGLRGALVGALVALALVFVWGQIEPDVHLLTLGYVIRAITLLVVAVLLGTFVERRRRLEVDILRYYDASLDLLATGTVNGRLTRVNPAWSRTLGHSAETLCTKRFIEFVHPEDHGMTLAQMRALAAGGEAVGFRNRFLAADGSYRWLEWSASAPGADGVVHAVARDVTAQHEAEHQLADNARTLELMITERTRELDEARAETLRQLAIAAEYRDDETYQHTERVGHIAARLALGLGLPAGQVTLLRQAAPLHDVGKLAIPDCILLKPGKLTEEEFEVMKTHAELGARLLSSGSSPVLQMAATIAANHHERWDGGGYPKRLSGEAIPLVGRIVAVADVFDALIHDRPYKQAWPIEQAIEEIGRGAGSQFDPRVVTAFLALRDELGTLREDLAELEQAELPALSDISLVSLPRRSAYLEHVDRHAPRAATG
ncbi:MAG TPA: HD domain-containing phosphohydrolase [Solirubrobacteraceae bacterium]|jgi:PAS domain S-box-containing protein|nr:HD domain-containing phosphohydrolase [Solirubrobacteraceae bacterium]